MRQGMHAGAERSRLTASKKVGASSHTAVDTASHLNELGSRFCPQRLQEQGSATTLTLFSYDTNQLSPTVLDFQPKNYKVINECCFKSLNL